MVKLVKALKVTVMFLCAQGAMIPAAHAVPHPFYNSSVTTFEEMNSQQCKESARIILQEEGLESGNRMEMVFDSGASFALGTNENYTATIGCYREGEAVQALVMVVGNTDYAATQGLLDTLTNKLRRLSGLSY